MDRRAGVLFLKRVQVGLRRLPPHNLLLPLVFARTRMTCFTTGGLIVSAGCRGRDVNRRGRD